MNTIYETNHRRSEGFMHLVGDLRSDIKTLIKKEVELARAEMSEKCSEFGRNTAFAAVGGLLALMAVFMLVLGLGAIIARLLIDAELSPGAAYSVSYMGLSLLLGGLGYFLIHKAMRAFSRISLAPEKALGSVHAAEPVPIEIKKKAQAKPVRRQSSSELQDEVIATRTRMDSEINELKSRLTPGCVARSVAAGVKHHPLRALLLSAASTGLGGYLYWRRQQRLALLKNNADALRRWWNLRMREA
jgi:hypothetical protein